MQQGTYVTSFQYFHPQHKSSTLVMGEEKWCTKMTMLEHHKHDSNMNLGEDLTAVNNISCWYKYID